MRRLYYIQVGNMSAYTRSAGITPLQRAGHAGRNQYMELTHTIKRYGGTVPSIGGVGGYVTVDPVIRVEWNDNAGTCLIVTDDRGRISAGGYHNGKSFDLPHRAGDMESVAQRWITAIAARLQETRLQDRVRGGVPQNEVAARVQAWNRKLEAQRAG